MYFNESLMPLKYNDIPIHLPFLFFFFNDRAPPEISPLPLHAALPICPRSGNLGHTPYSATPGNRAGFLGRGTTDQRFGCAVDISSIARGTLTRSPITSSTASGGRNLLTSYQAPRRSGTSRSVRNRAQYRFGTVTTRVLLSPKR